MKNKFITLVTLLAFTFVTLFSPFPGPSSRANAQAVTNTSSLRLVTGTSTATTTLSQPKKTTAVTIIPTPVISMSVCKFIDLLAGINAVTADRANSARSGMGCTTMAPVIVPPSQGGMTVCSFIDLLTNIGVVDINRANSARSTMGCAVNNYSSVVVRANGSTGPISVLPGTQIELSWQSVNTQSCSDGRNSLPVNGRAMLTVNTSQSYPVNCIGINGNTVAGSVTVIVANNQNATSSIQILSSNITPGYDFAVFDATTNVPTKMVIAYTDNLNSSSSFKIYESATSTIHSDKITGLLPNTDYYARAVFLAGPNDSVGTDQLTFTTLADGTSGLLTQRVLSSASGNGIVSIPGSDSLKTDTKVTLEAWVKPTSWNTTVGMSNTMDSVIISKGNIGGNIDYVLSLNNGQLVYSNNDASIWTTSPVVPLNKWTNVAVSVNESAGNVSLYVNGVKISSVSEGPRGVFSRATRINKNNAITEKVATSSSSAGGWDYNSITNNANNSGSGWDIVTPSPSTGSLQSLLPTGSGSNQVTSNVYFGNFYPSACNATSTKGNGFTGLVDDVKIWNTARTADQIKADIATTSATSTAATSTSSVANDDPALVGHWSFDDGRATDLTSNVNNGALKGDMEVLDDSSAVSPVVGSEFALNGLDFSFPETCDSNINASDETSGYEITFKGGVKSTTKTGQNSNVTLESCDNPTEDLVKSVKVIGNAPARDASFYNTMGTIAVTIGPGLFGMKEPKVRDTIQGTATEYISGPGAKGNDSLGAGSIGRATSWQPQTKTCMKPLKSKSQWQTIGMVAMVVVAIATCVAGCEGLTLLELAYEAAEMMVVAAAEGWAAGTVVESVPASNH